ncbi:MalY/PatB family protein [Salipiger sp. CCB-MM3]|uniref:MalY/PatB family protein n=1 Tax=Salipiger sp. CCB-MM3 TaxID=1792508 RepID=UPI000826E5E9|nr:MalY/PatB family protein [Salipiger sp. CCB-MM3]
MYDFDTEIDRRAVPALKTHRIVLGEDGSDLFPGGVADMDFPAAPCVQRAIAERAAHGIFGYEAVPDGLMPALTGWLARQHGWQVDPVHILRAPNVLNALAMAVNAFTDPGDGILIQPPVFFDFADIIRENGRRIVENPLLLQGGRYEMDFDGLEEAARDPGTKLLLLCNPHNPVGRVWTRAELTRLGDICRRHGVLVVSDEIHADITLPGHGYTPFASLSEADAANSVTCLSPAKSFNLAACCSAFTVIPDAARRRALQAANSALTVNKNNAFANVAMESAWREGDGWLDAALDYIAGNLALVRGALAGSPVKLIEPEGTFLLWLDFRALGLSPEALHLWLRQEAGWAITRGVSFGPQGAGFGRLNIACPRSRLARALDSMDRALAGFASDSDSARSQNPP